MRLGKLTYVIGALLASTAPALAQQASCAVEIMAPPANAQVGPTEDVVGSAVIPPGTKLWIFVHMRGLGVWWPQGGGSADIERGHWRVVAYFGEPRDTGRAFEITARVVESAENSKLEGWVKKAAETGQYPGIPMPTSVLGCNPNPPIIIVTKGN